MNTFRRLTKDDIKLIKKKYNKCSSREEAQSILSRKFNVSTRTIREWFKRINEAVFTPDDISCVTSKNILIIGDLHEPFSLNGYIDFVHSIYKQYKCSRVIFIGDIIDNHYSSYHETDPDGFGGGEELNLAINKIKKWYKLFPKADVLIGNHDRLIMRKAHTSAIPKEWIRDYKDVLKVPNWNFVDRLVINNIQFIHGEAGTARIKCKSDMQSTIQGHLHSQAYTEYFVGANYKIFGTQVGCGIDFDAYSMAYAKRGPKPAIGCVVLLNEELPVNIMMDL